MIENYFLRGEEISTSTSYTAQNSNLPESRYNESQVSKILKYSEKNIKEQILEIEKDESKRERLFFEFLYVFLNKIYIRQA